MNPSSPKETKEYKKKMLYVSDACPGSWLILAEELYNAAEIIWESRKTAGICTEISGKSENDGSITYYDLNKYPDIARPFYLLSGLALENLFKGIAVNNNPSMVNSGKLDKKLLTHDLVTLITYSEADLSDNELGLCKKINQAIPTWGKYPVSKSFNNRYIVVSLNDSTHSLMNGLFSRLSKELYKSIRKGWDSNVGLISNTWYRDYENDLELPKT